MSKNDVEWIREYGSEHTWDNVTKSSDSSILGLMHPSIVFRGRPSPAHNAGRKPCSFHLSRKQTSRDLNTSLDCPSCCQVSK